MTLDESFCATVKFMSLFIAMPLAGVAALCGIVPLNQFAEMNASTGWGEHPSLE